MIHLTSLLYSQDKIMIVNNKESGHKKMRNLGFLLKNKLITAYNFTTSSEKIKVFLIINNFCLCSSTRYSGQICSSDLPGSNRSRAGPKVRESRDPG